MDDGEELQHMVVFFSSLARICGECSTSHFPLASFCFLFFVVVVFCGFFFFFFSSGD